MERFIATFDLHFGNERRSGHKIPLHDPKAWASVVKFAQDFKPHKWIHGGDMLDCGVVSHHNHGKPGRTEGLRLLADATEGHDLFIKPVEELVKGEGNLIYMVGNHEDWLTDLVDDMPSLEGIVDVSTILKLKRWKIIPQGSQYDYGKLRFIHGDTISGGENMAKNAVTNHERNIRFGHFHTHQTFTKTSPTDDKLGKTGIAVPCLCHKNPRYNEGKPNRWMQGFLFGYMNTNGTFNDYVVTILDGQFIVNGKVYCG